MQMGKKLSNRLEETEDRRYDPDVMFGKQTKDKSYERYKKIQYCYLVLKAFLFFAVGLIVSYLLHGS